MKSSSSVSPRGDAGPNGAGSSAACGDEDGVSQTSSVANPCDDARPNGVGSNSAREGEGVLVGFPLLRVIKQGWASGSGMMA